MKKILIVISWITHGGAERIVSNTTTNFPPDWEIDILVNHACRVSFPIRGNIMELNIKEPKDKEGLWYNIKALIKKCLVLRKLKKHNQYTACISHIGFSNIANVLSGNRYCKTIVSIHSPPGLETSSIFTPAKNKLEWSLNKRADLVVTVSRGIEDFFTKKLGYSRDKVKTIYNGIDIANYVSDRSASLAKIPNNAFTFINTGRLVDPKGQWHLIRAFAQVVKKFPECNLVILGEGPLRYYLESLVKDLDLEENVHLPGFVDNTFDYYRQNSVFIFSSIWEGLPMAVVEAMACGLPVICADCHSGAREILSPDTDIGYEQKEHIEMAKYGIITPVCSGIKYSANDPPEKQELLLAEAMEMIYTDSRLAQKYAELSRERANDFSIQKTVEQWVELIS